MTVRQAVALSGGYDLISGFGRTPTQSRNRRSSARAWSICDGVRSGQDAIWRIEAELGGKASWTPREKQLQELRELPVSSSVLAQSLRFRADKFGDEPGGGAEGAKLRSIG